MRSGYGILIYSAGKELEQLHFIKKTDYWLEVGQVHWSYRKRKQSPLFYSFVKNNQPASLYIPVKRTFLQNLNIPYGNGPGLMCGGICAVQVVTVLFNYWCTSGFLWQSSLNSINPWSANYNCSKQHSKFYFFFIIYFSKKLDNISSHECHLIFSEK